MAQYNIHTLHYWFIYFAYQFQSTMTDFTVGRKQ